MSGARQGKGDAMNDTITIWVSKYALSKGVYEAQARDCGGGMVKVTTTGMYYFLHSEGTQWHRTREDAVARAEQMRQKRIVSLRKQIAKLQAMRFAD